MSARVEPRSHLPRAASYARSAECRQRHGCGAREGCQARHPAPGGAGASRCPVPAGGALSPSCARGAVLGEGLDRSESSLDEERHYVERHVVSGGQDEVRLARSGVLDWTLASAIFRTDFDTGRPVTALRLTMALAADR